MNEGGVADDDVRYTNIVTTLILNALAPEHARPVPCTLVLPAGKRKRKGRRGKRRH